MQTYAQMKDSGVAWLGDIPMNWDLKKMRYVAYIDTGNSIKDDEKQLYTGTTDSRPYISSKDIDVNTTNANYDNGLYIPLINSKFKVAPKDSTLLCIEGGSAGKKITFLSRDVSYVNKLCNFDAKNISQKFLFYFLRSKSFKSEFNLNITGLIGGVSKAKLTSFSVSVPPLSTQQEIADYLDEETARIDDLIAKQQRLLELLEEKRRATIIHAVTRGLNPNAELKETHIPWLGQIPAHWKLVPIKSVAQINNGGDYKDIEVVDGGYPVIGSGGEFARASKYAYDGKSVLFGRKGTVDKPLFFEGKFWTVDTMFWSEIDEDKILPKFLYFIALSIPYDYYQTKTALPSMTQSNILNHQIATPSMNEQSRIVDTLEARQEEFDILQQKILTQIDLLKERRTSLISSAVTGKIKV